MLQFSISDHYDVMAELDQDVHDDSRLAKTEVDLALRLIGHVPAQVLLPCCGTGRHIPRLLERGVRQIVGVDLSPQCLIKARRSFAKDSRVTLIEADLAQWRTRDKFDAVILLGNSFGDQVDSRKLLRVTAGMALPLKSGGAIVMDYIGEGYLDRLATSTTWDATFHGQPAKDRRTPRYDAECRILTIDVEVTHARSGVQLWRGSYHKCVLDDTRVRAHFLTLGVRMTRQGAATELNPTYYKNGHNTERGMIAASTWWVGTKI